MRCTQTVISAILAGSKVVLGELAPRLPVHDRVDERREAPRSLGTRRDQVKGGSGAEEEDPLGSAREHAHCLR